MWTQFPEIRRAGRWMYCALVVAGLVSLAGLSAARAKPPGGGSGSTKSYTIVDLPGPYHQADGNYSYVSAERISDPSPAGMVYVLGAGISDGLPCLWRVDAARNVATIDISSWLSSAYDVNSAGIVAGKDTDRPALLLPNLTRVYLAGAGIPGEVRALNNPDADGDFQAVGNMVTDSSGLQKPVLWDIAADGTVLAATPLVTPSGQTFYCRDINDTAAMAGVVMQANIPVATIGQFDAGGALQFIHLPNPDPATIKGYWDMHIDESGDVLAHGYEVTLIDGWLTATLSRAVIWPAAGGAIDLGSQTGIASTEGNGIATVAGVMQVIGRAEDDGRSAFAYRYTNGRLQDLNTLSAGDQPWILQRGAGVNRAGMMCGLGKVGSRRSAQWHGFLLIPSQ